MIGSQQVSAKQVVHYRNYRRARDRALVRLSHLYPDTYKQLLEEQRRFDEQEGKTWFIDDNVNLVVGVHTRANNALTEENNPDKSRVEDNDGGEA